MLRQIWIVSALNFKSLKSRFWQSMVIVVGLGATIAVARRPSGPIATLGPGGGMSRAPGS